MKTINTIILIITVIIIISAGTSSGLAAEYYVDGDMGQDENAGTAWGASFQTIQHAIDSVVDGDTIHVAGGIYTENITLKPGITLLGGYTSGGGEREWRIYQTVIDGNQAGKCVVGADGVLMEGFYIRNGRSLAGAGISHSYVTMTVRDCYIHHCVATGGNPYGGGGMHFVNSESLIENCFFISNETNIDPEFEGTEVNGGAIQMWTSSPTFINCTIEDNHVIDVTATRGRFGGGVWAVTSQPAFYGCYFKGNSAAYGGGLGFWNRSVPIIEDCVFEENDAYRGGGGIAGMFNVDVVQPAYSQIKDCVFRNNHAESGGGLLILRNSRINVINCLFSGNEADKSGGGAMVMYQSIVKFKNCTIVENRMAGDTSHGSALYCGEDTEMQVKDCIIAYNTGAEALYFEGIDPMQVWVETSDVFGNSPENYSRNIIDRTGIAGTISADPLFVTLPVSGDYYLSEPDTGSADQINNGRSPCINTGSGTVAGMNAGERTTRTDRVSDMATADMGYHYFRPGPYLAPLIPFRFQREIAVGTSLVLDIRDQEQAIDPGRIEMRLDGVPVLDLTVEPIYRGYRLEYTPPEPLEICREYAIGITAYNENSVPLADGIITFETEGCPPEPTPTPPPGTGAPELNFLSGSTRFTGGDEMDIAIELYNPWFQDNSVDLYIALEVAGTYYMFPDWNDTVTALPENLYPGEVIVDTVLTLELPENLGIGGPFWFLAVMTEPGTYTLVGEVAALSIYFE